MIGHWLKGKNIIRWENDRWNAGAPGEETDIGTQGLGLFRSLAHHKKRTIKLGIQMAQQIPLLSSGQTSAIDPTLCLPNHLD
jgi:hypothetical protein